MTRRAQTLVTVAVITLALILMFMAWNATKDLTVLAAAAAALLIVTLLWTTKKTVQGRPEALTEEKDIAAHLEALREGASDFYAVWSGEYPEVEVERYFEAERKALETNRALNISRVINPTVIPDKHYNLLQSMRQEFGSRFELYEDATIHFFELFVAEYPDAGPVAVVVVNDIVSRRPKVGLVLDPGRNPALLGAVGAVKEWFKAIRGGLREFERPAVERWDHIAPRYTKYVSDNFNQIAFLDSFTSDEGNLVGDYLGSLAEPGQNLVVVEVGCGDGRALLRYLPTSLANCIAYVVGLDYAPAMLQAAEGELVKRLSDSEGSPAAKAIAERTGFYRLNAFDMRRFFDDGHLRDLERFEMASRTSRSRGMDPTTFAGARKVFFCLLNTIGVIEPLARRKEMVESMLAALGHDDRLILTVFAADAFEEKAEELYDGLEPMLDMKIKKDHYEFANATFQIDGIPGYYSHWFEESELLELLTSAALSLGGDGRAFARPDVKRMGSNGFFVEIRRTG